jgi:hypothetical protein
MRVTHQKSLEFKSWGGAREGAGRKREGKRARVAHSKRSALRPSHPAHITLRIEDGLNNLRNRSEYATVRQAARSRSESIRHAAHRVRSAVQSLAPGLRSGR